jgi:hypothetical protein
MHSARPTGGLFFVDIIARSSALLLNKRLSTGVSPRFHVPASGMIFKPVSRSSNSFTLKILKNVYRTRNRRAYHYPFLDFQKKIVKHS